MMEWLHPYPAWLVAVLATGLLIFLWMARRLASSGRLRSGWFFVPRLIVFVLLLLILLNPTRREEHRLPPEPAEVDFLIDASRSMALDAPDSRTTLVGYVLQDLENYLSRSDAPHVRMFRFGASLASVSDFSEASPHADLSDLSQALEQLPLRFGREAPRAIVIFSDGRLDDADRLPELARDYQSLNLPIHVFPVGDERVRGDVAIDDLVLPPRAEPGAKVPVRGAIRSRGFDGERVVVQVVSSRRPDLGPLATLPITLSQNAPQPFELTVEVQPEFGELTLEVEAIPGEATQVNNQVPFQLAQPKRKIRVLYMEGTGGNEYRWLRDALQEDPNIECLAMVADQQYVERQRLVRVDDPYRGYPATRAELLEFDCVICSDINLGAFTREQLEWTVELVAQRGGGFAMVGGITSFGAGGWDQTVWDQLIPVDMAGGTLGQGWLYHTFQVDIPPEARSHPIWRIVEDLQENDAALQSIPPFFGTNYMQRLKPAATTLAVSREEIPGAGIMPIFAVQPYGRGRTFAFAPDTTESWGTAFERDWGVGDNRYYRRFWRNVVRWLTENSVNGSQRIRLEADRALYRSGQPVTLKASAFDEQQQLTQAYRLEAFVRAEGSDEVLHTQTLDRDAVQKGVYRLSLDPAAWQQALSFSDSTGGVRQVLEVEVVASDTNREVGRAVQLVQVLPDLHEFLQPMPDEKPLAEIAAVTGGTVYRSASELQKMLQALPISQPDSIITRQPTWDRPGLWTLILLLLAVEWVARRRAALV